MFSDAQVKRINEAKLHIANHLQKMKRQEWYSSMLPWNNMFLSGGAIASLLQGEQPKDWDFYFINYDSMDKIRTHVLQYRDAIADVDPKYMEVLGEDGKMITANAITMKDGSSFITMIVGPAHDVKNSFDFIHCTPHYQDDKLYISENQYECCTKKLLRVNNILRIKSERTDKFVKRGYKDEATLRSI